MPWTQLFQQGMEGRRMVRMAQMAELVEEHIVAQFFRQKDEGKVQVDVSLAGATAPVRFVALDAYRIIAEPMQEGQLPEAGRKSLLRQGTEPLDVFPGRRSRSGPSGFPPRLLPDKGLPDPFPVSGEECK